MEFTEKELLLTSEEIVRLGDRVYTRRKSLGESQKTLAEKTTLALSTIQKIENGRDKKRKIRLEGAVRIDTLNLLCTELKCEKEYLLGLSMYPTEEDRDAAYIKQLIGMKGTVEDPELFEQILFGFFGYADTVHTRMYLKGEDDYGLCKCIIKDGKRKYGATVPEGYENDPHKHTFMEDLKYCVGMLIDRYYQEDPPGPLIDHKYTAAELDDHERENYPVADVSFEELSKMLERKPLILFGDSIKK